MLPVGIIALWSGAIVDIPADWHLCDGTAGTVDLRDKFIVGAGNAYNPGDVGGSGSHTHTFTGDGHSHSLAAGPGLEAGTSYFNFTNSVPATGTTNPATNLPPYYALAYIQRI